MPQSTSLPSRPISFLQEKEKDREEEEEEEDETPDPTVQEPQKPSLARRKDLLCGSLRPRCTLSVVELLTAFHPPEFSVGCKVWPAVRKARDSWLIRTTMSNLEARQET